MSPRQKRKVSTDKDPRSNAPESLFRTDADRLSEEKAAQKTRRSKYFIAGAVSLITFLVYLTCLRNEFLNYDDTVYVYENLYLRTIDLTFLQWAFSSFYAANWHPLTWISHALDYAIWGLNPVGHHLTNIIIHAVNTALVVLISVSLLESNETRTVTKETAPWLTWRSILITGGMTGFLFGLHPIHVESVAWVAERKDLLCALFFLSSIMTYMKYAKDLSNSSKSPFPFRHRQYLITFGFFVLALLSKPMAVSLPAVLLILDWYPLKRIQSLRSLRSAFIEKAPFIILSFLSSFVTIRAQKAGGAMGLMDVVPLSIRALVAAKSLLVYLLNILAPVNLSPHYPYPNKVSFLSVEFLFATSLVIGITVICIIVAKAKRIWLSVWSYYVVTLIPVLGIVQVGPQAMADRYMYLPSLGPLFIIGATAAKAYEGVSALNERRKLFKLSSLCIGSAMLISMSYATVTQIGIWKDSTVFWSYVAEKNPSSYFAHNNLGLGFASKGNLDRAISEFQTALRLNPGYAEAHNNLGYAYSSQGNLDKAIFESQAALRLNPDYEDAHNNLGYDYAAQGNTDMAIPEFQAALRLNPDHADAHYNLGTAYASIGNMDMAIPEFQVALRLKPDHAETHYNLGTAFTMQGNLDRAVPEFQAALRLKPDYYEARQHLNDILSRRH